MGKPLSPKQERFVENYLVHSSIRRACKESGVHERTGTRWMQEPRFQHVREELEKRQKERSERLELDADFVLRELYDTLQVLKAEVKPKLSSKTGKPIKDEDGNAVYTRNDNAILRCLDLLGRHMNVKAWDNTVKVDVDADLIERLERGRRRMRGEDTDGL
jgi:phage terminase small subunit